MKSANETRTAACAAHAALCNNGFIDLMSGTKPAGANTAITSQVVLATLTFGATAYGTPTNGVATANAIGSGTGTAGAGAGTACTWGRAYRSDHTTAVDDKTAGATGSGMEIILASATISTGLTVPCSSCTLTYPDGT